MKRGFSASTAVLVVLLLGILVWVGKVVNPPSTKGHDHSDEETAQKTADAKPTANAKPTMKEPVAPMLNRKEDMQRHMAEEQKKAEMQARMKAMQAASAKASGSGAKKTSTAPDGMEPSLWQQRDMGPVTPSPDAKK